MALATAPGTSKKAEDALEKQVEILEKIEKHLEQIVELLKEQKPPAK